MNEPVPTAQIERAAVLIEKRLHAGLTPDEQAELDRLVAAHPWIAADLSAAEQEARAMTAITQDLSPSPDSNGDIPPFDFDRARRVIENKLKAERGVLISLAGWTIITPPMLIAISWPNTNWALIAWCTILPGAPIAFWAVYRWRESIAFRKALAAGPTEDRSGLESAWARHIRRGRNEYAAMGACVALVCLALIVWLIELVDEGAWPLVPFALIGAGVMGYHGVRRLWTRRAREQHDRELAGLDTHNGNADHANTDADNTDAEPGKD